MLVMKVGKFLRKNQEIKKNLCLLNMKARELLGDSRAIACRFSSCFTCILLIIALLENKSLFDLIIFTRVIFCNICMMIIQKLSPQVLRCLVKVYQKLPSPDYLSICQCLMFLDEPEGVASILEKLLRSENKDDALLAFQIAFDLVENEHQAFLLNVRDRLSNPKSQPSESVQPGNSDPDSAQNENPGASEDVEMTDGSRALTGRLLDMDPNEALYAERLTKIKGILSGETSIQLTLQFLYSHNK